MPRPVGASADTKGICNWETPIFLFFFAPVTGSSPPSTMFETGGGGGGADIGDGIFGAKHMLTSVW